MKCLIVAAAFFCAQAAAGPFAAPNDRGIAFGHMHLVVADPELHKRLWPDLFGADLVEKQGYAAVRVADALIFFREGEPTATSAETAVDHFGLKVRDLQTVLARWRALGYSVDAEQPGPGGGAVAFITMPGGIGLALQEEPRQAADTSMGYVHFATPRRNELMSWYAEHFGVAAGNPDDDSHVMSIPGSELRFEDTQADRLPTDGTAIDHIGFEVQDWDELIEALRDAGIRFEFGPAYIESLDLWVAFFNDPGGALVEITHGLNHF